MTDFKVVPQESFRQVYRVVIPRREGDTEQWGESFEVETRLQKIICIRCLTASVDDRTWFGLKIEAFLKLIDALKQKGYTL